MIIKATDIGTSVGLPEKVLLFRPYGEKAYKILLDRLNNELESRELIEIDFSDIDSADLSFLDEVVLNLHIYIRKNRENIFFVSNLSNDVRDSLIGAIEYKRTINKIKVPILYKKDGKLTIIGNIEPLLKETFDLFNNFKTEITAKDLSQLKGLAMNNACTRLKKLYNLGLIMREEKDEYYYKLPIPNCFLK